MVSWEPFLRPENQPSFTLHCPGLDSIEKLSSKHPLGAWSMNYEENIYFHVQERQKLKHIYIT